MIDLGNSLGILNMVSHWRVWLFVLAAALLGWVLTVPVEWVSGLQGIALPFFGLFGGIYWDSAAQLGSPKPKTTLAVAILSAAVIGCVWGAVSFKVPIAGAALLLAAFVIWYSFAVVVRRWFSNGNALVIGSASLITFCVVAFLVRNAA